MSFGTWTKSIPTGIPVARAFAAASYYTVGDISILFGGNDGTTPRLSDTHSWNGSIWAVLAPATVPAARDGHMMADSLNDDLYLFGGETGGGLSNQLYAWDGSDWTLAGGSPPLARRDAGMATGATGNADHVRTGSSDHVWLYGGTLVAAGGDDAVHKWDGAAWSSHTPAFVPPTRHRHAMWFDPIRDGIVIAYGLDITTDKVLDDVWFYDGVTWTEITPPTRPSARAVGMAAAYDVSEKRTLFTSQGLPAVGQLTVPIGFEFVDGEIVTIDDGVNAATVFELDDNASVGGGNVAVVIDGAGLGDAEVMRDRWVTAINGASTFDSNLRTSNKPVHVHFMHC